MKTFKEWYLEFLPHPDDPKPVHVSDLGLSSWVERTNKKLIKRQHLRRIKRLVKLH